MTEPKPPPARAETSHTRLREALSAEPLSARELSQRVSLSEKEVLDHLLRVARTLSAEGRSLDILPARCKSCGSLPSPPSRAPARP